MFRYIYFISLLLCICLSEAKFLRSSKRHVRSNRHEQLRAKIDSKQDGYETFDDQEPETYINVARFIQSPDDTSIDDKQFENRISLKDDPDFGGIVNSEAEKDRSRDYQSLEFDNIPEVNVYSEKRTPKYLHINGLSTEGIINQRFYKANQVKNIGNDMSLDTNLEHLTHPQKKCALKKMRIPFFSRDKDATTKTKKNKKRKLFAFRNSKKNSSVTNLTDRHINSNDIKGTTKENPQTIKVDKRSYFERLCPACKQKIFINSNGDLIDKFQRTANSMVHNSRQHNQNNKYEEDVSESNKQPNSLAIKHNNFNSESKNIDDYINDRRWNRNELLFEKQNKI